MHDIVDTAVAAGSFKTLVAAVAAADLVDTLKSVGPFTVFAPTDAAFAQFPAAVIQDLLKPANKVRLQGILTYHIIAGKFLAADVVDLKNFKTIQGQDLSIDTTDGVKVDDANVVRTDIQCSNGVIHVIDAVVLPK